jgi:hypothetical protein
MAFVAPTAFAAGPFGYNGAELFGQQTFTQQAFSQQAFAPQAFSQQVFAPQAFSQQVYAAQPQFVQQQFQPEFFQQQQFVQQQPVVAYEQPVVAYEQPVVAYEQPIIQVPIQIPTQYSMAPTITNRGPPNVPVPTWTRKRDPSYSHPELFLTGVGNGMFQQFKSKKSSQYPFHHPGI